GATNRGTFHEGLNMASIWKLPVVFVCENNQWASTASSKEMLSVKDVAQRASAYAIPGITADGNDVLEVHRLSKEAIERVRDGDGPTLLEFKTFRIKGHFVGDPELYRTKEEVEEWMKKEPIERFKKYLYENGYLTKEDEQLIENSILNEIEEAVEFARSSPFPAPEDALTDLFVDDRGYDYY
ncbi:MAG: pyruvate dehydrogenase (acetyl-transferring) E1 component subunit alpha, partial [Synergistetes bacterium]|nr:pyruvate dehydrogenase (acetyl-transferring) E1 component subunit alpha [Synergistota bacterium]